MKELRAVKHGRLKALYVIYKMSFLEKEEMHILLYRNISKVSKIYIYMSNS